MDIRKSRYEKGIIGICGHIGVGHTHSHSGFVQDDSAGLAVVASLLKKVLPIDSTIESVEVDINKSTITIQTVDGGIGHTSVRRGITPHEAEMIENILNKDAIYSQRIVLNTLGRIYGQGVMEVPVALQGAISLALIDTFQQKWSQEVFVVGEDISSNYGKILGSVIDIKGIPVSVLLTMNASLGGIGPIEDLEGNIMLGKKGQLIKKLGLDKIPSIIIESKSFIPGKEDNLSENTFLIRANKEFDNLIVANSLIRAADELRITNEYQFDTLDREADDFTKASRKLGNHIIQLGEEFERAETSEEKVRIISDLAVLVSQDAAGVTFMSNELQRSVGSAGMLKGTSAVISLLVTKEYIDYYKIPFILESDIEKYISIIYKGILKLEEDLDGAQAELIEKFDFEEEKYEYLYR